MSFRCLEVRNPSQRRSTSHGLHVKRLPAGRNFLAIDPPRDSNTDFLVPRQGLADLLLERYGQEQASNRLSWRPWVRNLQNAHGAANDIVHALSMINLPPAASSRRSS